MALEFLKRFFEQAREEEPPKTVKPKTPPVFKGEEEKIRYYEAEIQALCRETEAIAARREELDQQYRHGSDRHARRFIHEQWRILGEKQLLTDQRLDKCFAAYCATSVPRAQRDEMQKKINRARNPEEGAEPDLADPAGTNR